jgi:hypothetical protein
VDRPGLFPLAAAAVVGFAAVMMVFTNGGSSQPPETAVAPPPTTSLPTTIGDTITATTGTSVSPTTMPAPATNVAVLDGWETLAPPFGQRWHAGLAWSGSELLVWGGASRPPSDSGVAVDAATATGYRYHPATSSWAEMATSELCEMARVGSAWTDGAFTKPELIVWSAGAADRVDDCELYGAYDPDTDTWRYLNDDLSRRFFNRLGSGTSVVWTGELLVAPSVGLALDPVDGPLLDIPDVPRNADDGVFSPRVAHWTGEELLVLGSDELYRLQGDDWVELPGPPIMDRARTSAFSGGELLAVNYEMETARWDGQAWQATDPLPLRFYECTPLGLSSGVILAVEHCGPFAVWDDARELFVPIPAPVDWSTEWRGGQPFVGGDSLYVIGDGAFRYQLEVDGGGSLDLPATMPIGVHFLDIPGDLDLTMAVGPVQEVVDDQFITETMTFEFETTGAACSIVTTYLGTAEPPGVPGFAAVVFAHTGEVVFGTEYDDGGSLTIRLPSRNGSDVVDVSCGDPEATRLLAAQLWEPEY